MSNDELFVDGVPLHRPAQGIHWIGEVYPTRADPIDTWNGEPIGRGWIADLPREGQHTTYSWAQWIEGGSDKHQLTCTCGWQSPVADSRKAVYDAIKSHVEEMR